MKNHFIRRATVIAVACSIVCGCVNSASFRKSLSFSDGVADSARPNKSHRQAAKPASSDTTNRVISNASAGRAKRTLEWARAGSTADGQFELKRIRNGDNRTLVVGSLRGFDPPAIAIMDQLAAQLARDAAILGGLDCLLVRTANPDGLKHRSVTNSNGIELQHAFPPAVRFNLKESKEIAEVVFLARLLRQFQPQRVIIIGQTDDSNGGIVYSHGAKDIARPFADVVDLPDYSLARQDQAGSFEQFVADSKVEIISIRLPASTTVETGWSRFGIWLPSLLASE